MQAGSYIRLRDLAPQPQSCICCIAALRAYPLCRRRINVSSTASETQRQPSH